MFLFIVETSEPSTKKYPDGIFAYIWAAIVGFLLALVTSIRSFPFLVRMRIRDSESDSANNIPNMSVELESKEESRPPSPASRYTKEDVLSSALDRLGELEKKVDMLQSKPNVMPSEKEELLNAAVYRVDALEAELIATKKVMYPSKPFYLLQAAR